MFVRNVASRSAFKIRYLKTYSSANLEFQYRFFSTGSTALIKLLQNLRIGNGSSILIPSFICDSVTSALECSGYKVVFIEPDRNRLWPEVASLRQVVERNKIDAVLFVEYFGFEIRSSSEMFEIFESKGIPIIIDRCHSSLLVADYDSRVKYKFFSFSKSLPVPRLGAYEISSKVRIKKSNLVHFITLFLVKNFLVSILFHIKYTGISIFTIRDWLLTLRSRAAESRLNLNQKSLKIGAPVISMLSDQVFMRRCRRRRRACYHLLTRHAKPLGFEILKLNKNDVPQAFVIKGEDSAVVEGLRAKGIGAYRWPGPNNPEVVRNDKESYPVANTLASSLVCIPLHEDLKLPDLDWIIKILGSIKGGYG